MIAHCSYNTKVYYGTTCYGTITASSDATDADSTTCVYIQSDGWQEVTNEELVKTKIREPAQEQDEPDTGERPVYWERPQRRLATARMTRDRPQQLESTFG